MTGQLVPPGTANSDRYLPPTAAAVPEWAPDEAGPHWADDLGAAPIPSDRYWSREYYDLEMRRVWGRCWQLACFENDIPDVGDVHVYDIGRLSFIIVRADSNEIKAFFNSCLHRGTRLVESADNVNLIKCPYHAWAWDLGGSLKHVPAEWDFPRLRKETMCLPQARVGTWGGMVFINPSPDGIALAEHLSPIPDHCSRHWPMERRARIAHVAKVFRANWKLVFSAFVETYHLITVHPQMGTRIQAGNGRDAAYRSLFQFDYWGRTSRNQRLERTTDSPPIDAYPTGFPPASLGVPLPERLGVGPDQLSPEEVNRGSVIYHAFPNLQVGVVTFDYITRMRPYNDDPEMTIMDIWITTQLRDDEEMPPAPVRHLLGPDDPMIDAPEILLGGTDPVVYQQDVDVLHAQQRGLHSMAPGHTDLMLGEYMEACVRHHNHVLNEFMVRP